MAVEKQKAESFEREFEKKYWLEFFAVAAFVAFIKYGLPHLIQ